MSFFTNILTCPGCGAVAPQASKSRQRVSSLRFACSNECRRTYFEKVSGLPLYSDVLMSNTGHMGTVEISKDDLEAGGAYGDVDWREQLERAVDAWNPQAMPRGPFA